MAYGFGTGVQAGLGATDYSNYLRGALSGAEMSAQGQAAIGQGIQNALSSIGVGLQQRAVTKEKMAERDRLMKEQEKMQTGQIKASANILRGFTMDETMPEYVRSQAYQTLSQLDNPYSDTAEKFGIASQASETIKGLLGIAERGESMQQNKAITDAIAANREAGTGNVDLPGALQSAIELGAPPAFAAQQLSSIAKLSPSGKPAAVYATAEDAINSIPDAQRENYNVKFNPTLGGYFPEPMTRGEQLAEVRFSVEQGESQRKQEEAQAKEAARIEASRYSLGIAKDTAGKAITLSLLGAGGPLQGLPIVRDVTAALLPEALGAGQSKTLASYIDTLKSVLTVENLKQLKELSATGASGFGQLSDREGEILASTIAKLDASMSEPVLRENLAIVGKLLNKMRGGTTQLSPNAQKYLNP